MRYELVLLARFLFVAIEACISRSSKLRLEFFDSTFRVDEFLLSSIERVAGTTDIDLQFLLCASGLKCIATTTLHCGLKIFWVDIFFHRFAHSTEKFRKAGLLKCISHLSHPIYCLCAAPTRLVRRTSSEHGSHNTDPTNRRCGSLHVATTRRSEGESGFSHRIDPIGEMQPYLARETCRRTDLHNHQSNGCRRKRTANHYRPFIAAITLSVIISTSCS